MMNRLPRLLILSVLCMAVAFMNCAPSHASGGADYAHVIKRKTGRLQEFIQNRAQPRAVPAQFCGRPDPGFAQIASAEHAHHVLMKPRDVVFSKISTDIGYLSMTFDDCPHGNTLEILDVLKKYSMRATFFVLGRYALNHPDIIKRMAEEGHTIANHTYDHTPATELDREQLERQIGFTESVVFDNTGGRTLLFRPPYGLISGESVEIITQMGYSTVLWSVDTRDYISAADSVGLAQQAGPGDIVLFHTKSSSGETIEMICRYYAEQDLQSVPIEELLAMAYADEHGAQSLAGEDVFVN